MTPSRWHTQDLKCPLPDRAKGFRKGWYSECLTRLGSYLFCFALDPTRNLNPSTEAQGVLRIREDRPCKDGYRQGVVMVLETTRFGGFFFACRKRKKWCIAKRLHLDAAFSSFSAYRSHLIYIHPLSTGSAWGHGR